MAKRQLEVTEWRTCKARKKTGTGHGAPSRNVQEPPLQMALARKKRLWQINAVSLFLPLLRRLGDMATQLYGSERQHHFLATGRDTAQAGLADQIKRLVIQLYQHKARSYALWGNVEPGTRW